MPMESTYSVVLATHDVLLTSHWKLGRAFRSRRRFLEHRPLSWFGCSSVSERNKSKWERDLTPTPHPTPTPITFNRGSRLKRCCLELTHLSSHLLRFGFGHTWKSFLFQQVNVVLNVHSTIRLIRDGTISISVISSSFLSFILFSFLSSFYIFYI